MFVTLSGIVIFVNPVQFSNAQLPITFMVLGIVMLDELLHPEKA